MIVMKEMKKLVCLLLLSGGIYVICVFIFCIIHVFQFYSILFLILGSLLIVYKLFCMGVPVLLILIIIGSCSFCYFVIYTHHTCLDGGGVLFFTLPCAWRVPLWGGPSPPLTCLLYTFLYMYQPGCLPIPPMLYNLLEVEEDVCPHLLPIIPSVMCGVPISSCCIYIGHSHSMYVTILPWKVDLRFHYIVYTPFTLYPRPPPTVLACPYLYM